MGHPLSRRVLIVGSGVVGLCTALYCLRRGFEVTLVDRDVPSRRSCSFGNAGMIVPSHFVPLAAPGAVAQGLQWMLDPRAPFHIRPRPSLALLAWLLRFARSANRAHVERAGPVLRDLCLASRDRYEALAATPGAGFDLAQRGLLLVCLTQHALAEEAHASQRARELGLPAEVHDVDGARALDPGLRDDIAGGVFYPLDGHLVPERLMSFLEAEVTRAGGRMLWQTDVTGWRRDGRTVGAACTNAGDLAADEFVLCGGAWSPPTARALALRIPIEAGKGYSLTLPDRADMPAHCTLLAEARVAVTPMGGGVRFAGTMELDGRDLRIDAQRVRAIVDAASRYFQVFRPADFDGIAPWSGLRPCTPDGMPYIGRSARYANLTIAAGHAMMGVTLAPVTGTMVAQILCNETPPFDMAMLAPDRFG